MSRSLTARRRSPQLMVPALARLRAWWPMLLALTLVGAVAGAAVAAQRARSYHATQVSILLAQPPVYLAPDSARHRTTRRPATSPSTPRPRW